ncbi:MAG TPA: prolyl oligopeptidase family serine peptidase [Gemmataceae bacterium]|nr:prolyl oligopeptidase family serine peptidase [Gemmataceae bacterium]
MKRWPFPALAGSLLLCGLAVAEDARPTVVHPDERGSVLFKPHGDQQRVPDRYRLELRSFPYEMTFKRDLPSSGLTVSFVHFPSPVTTDCPENNTVYAEYYRPKGKGPFPGVIVLDITAGDQSLSRTISTSLAQNGVAALFVQMAYYGPRRPPGSKLRLLSTNIPRTMDAIRQTVLDVRMATAWLEVRPEIDPKRLGIHGTSLGSMVGALAAEMEPKLRRVSIALGGGGLVDAYYEDPRAASYREFWEALGGTKKRIVDLLAPVDPLTYAANLKGRDVLMIAGKRDEIIPPRATKALWKAAGEPKIVWYDCSHYGAALYFVPIMNQVVKHFKDAP